MFIMVNCSLIRWRCCCCCCNLCCFVFCSEIVFVVQREGGTSCSEPLAISITTPITSGGFSFQFYPMSSCIDFHGGASCMNLARALHAGLQSKNLGVTLHSYLLCAHCQRYKNVQRGHGATAPREADIPRFC
jgi:hypothetical protein